MLYNQYNYSGGNNGKVTSLRIWYPSDKTTICFVFPHIYIML